MTLFRTFFLTYRKYGLTWSPLSPFSLYYLCTMLLRENWNTLVKNTFSGKIEYIVYGSEWERMSHGRRVHFVVTSVSKLIFYHSHSPTCLLLDAIFFSISVLLHFYSLTEHLNFSLKRSTFSLWSLSILSTSSLISCSVFPLLELPRHVSPTQIHILINKMPWWLPE